jgi:hypothetical protein
VDEVHPAQARAETGQVVERAHTTMVMTLIRGR